MDSNRGLLGRDALVPQSSGCSDPVGYQRFGG